MKILVIGNGFDLAHYLPTSYNHFMGVMAAIEKLPDGKDEIGFDDLFGELAEQEQLDQKEWHFFDRTKELYATESMRFDSNAIKTIKEKLKENSWYRYFKKHMEIETWIDFETKIGEALEVFGIAFIEFDRKKEEQGGTVSEKITNIKNDNRVRVFIEKRDADLLEIFKFLIRKGQQNLSSGIQPYGGVEQNWDEFNPDFIEIYDRAVSRIRHSNVLNYLKLGLNQFVEIFDLYFCAIISQFKPKNEFIYLVNNFDGLTNVYSFNCTSTFSNFYPKDEKGRSLDGVVDYLHGQAGNPINKIVLGISKLPNKILKKHKAYGFVKYHQKLFNGTDYEFLRENSHLMEMLTPMSQYFNSENVEIVIWGHSLDVSDQEYIKEIFSFNRIVEPEGKEEEQKDFYVKVIVLFHNEASKFSMLSNLLHILGKKLVERWMKKDWLEFKSVPDIYKENIQS